MKKITIIALATLTLLGGLLLGAKMIQIKGSDTMVNLVQILAEEYMGQKPGAAIAVLGGGSGTGITGLINQTCDVATHSREWKPKEIDQAWEKGVSPKFFVVAVDGLSVVVNEKNPIEQLTMAQVGALYRGEVKNWKALGGESKAVSLYGRQSNSGTYVFMQEFVLGNKNYSTDMKEMNGNAQIIEGILQDEGAVGYVGVGYLYDENRQIRKGLKVLKISKEPNGTGYLPTDKAAVDSGNYPISRPLFMATNGKPKGVAAEFLQWIVGPEGQAVVEREGFFTVGEGKYKAGNDKNFK
ncbi:MAG: phosphate ABC transporter substrate-binding protein [Candidatus Aminicenantes bacterium]|nr:phosphate ABC transporter substrate-binding protein [Candidatus Aminicenantes bacterium]